MSILLVDLGNTRLKWARADGDRPLASEVLLHRDQPLAALLDTAWAAQPRPERVLIASVADPACRDSLNQWLQRQWSLTPDWLVSPARGQGLQNSYAEPARLGCDRWAAMVAAFQLARAAVCVVDCGTAVTLDVVDATGMHRGGLILPGLSAMQTALTGQTALAPVDPARVVSGLLASATEDAIVLGARRAVAALVQQTVTELAQQQAIQARCYLTGGDAERIAPLLALPYELVPDLVLQGLAVIAHAT